jgi:PAS domain S-box-containing protein
MGEEAAVAMMRAGAHDYVMKDALGRLVPAVARELGAAEERRVRRRGEAAMAHLAAIVESCDDAIISKSLDGTILSWNEGAERLYGYTAGEMIGRHISLLLPPDRSRELQNILESVQRGERREPFETVRMRKDRLPVDILLTVSPIKDAEGRVTAASAIARNISQRKREEQERLQLIQELTDALARAKTLGGLLPICASCKKIRNDNGYWQQVEAYVKEHSNAEFTHSLCPECLTRLYPELKLNT